jgi:hypothetical protein
MQSNKLKLMCSVSYRLVFRFRGIKVQKIIT